MKKILAILGLLSGLLAIQPVAAQQAVVQWQCAAQGQACPANATYPLPVAQYNSGTTITANGSGTTGAVVGTLAASATKSTYICGFDVSAIGGTAAVGPVVVAGLLGGSFTYQMSSSAAGVTLSRTFAPCIQSSAINTAITVTTTADGSASAVNVNAWGFQQ